MLHASGLFVHWDDLDYVGLVRSHGLDIQIKQLIRAPFKCKARVPVVSCYTVV
jgi:hypothetical protein